jgi:lipopolysaccharide export system protein LptA
MPPFQSDDAPASDTGDVERAFVRADSLSTLQRGGERIQELFENVFVRQDTTRIRSEFARRYLNRDEILFVDDVVLYERGDTLRADSVQYNRATEVGRARGNVRLTNGDVTVRADRATYYSPEQRAVFPDSVVLVDSNRVLRARYGTYWSDEERAEFGGGVRLTEPGTTLLSDSLTYYRDEDRSIARGNVFVDRRGEEDAQRDTTSRTYLFGDWVDNQEAQRYSRVEGNALLVRVRMDSTGAPTDTLVVRARRLEAFRTDTHRRLVAVESVRIWQPDLAAVADSAVYDRVIAPTPDSATTVPIDTTRPPPDSITVLASETMSPPQTTASRPDTSRSSSLSRDTSAADSLADADSLAEAAEERIEAKEQVETREQAETEGNRPPRSAPDTTSRRPSTARSASPDSLSRSRRGSSTTPKWASQTWDTPTAASDSLLPLEETRLFRSPVTWFEDSQVWGDSIRVRARNREPDTVFVRGSAFAAQRDSVLDRIQQLKAHNLVAYFNDGSLRRLRAQPNAQAIRFLASENDSLNGAARTSGDRILLRFEDGGVKRISVIGGTQTTYYRKNANIPDPFELEGFQWTPDRRPTRAKLLRDERVRERLDLDLAPPRSRPVARSGPRSRRDSTTRPLARPSSQPRGAEPRRSVPDSLRRTNPVPADSLDASAQPRVPPDTSESKRNPDP